VPSRYLDKKILNLDGAEVEINRGQISKPSRVAHNQVDESISAILRRNQSK
jgi:hypothetical protein